MSGGSDADSDGSVTVLPSDSEDDESPKPTTPFPTNKMEDVVGTFLPAAKIALSVDGIEPLSAPPSAPTFHETTPSKLDHQEEATRDVNLRPQTASPTKQAVTAGAQPQAEEWWRGTERRRPVRNRQGKRDARPDKPLQDLMHRFVEVKRSNIPNAGDGCYTKQAWRPEDYLVIVGEVTIGRVDTPGYQLPTTLNHYVWTAPGKPFVVVEGKGCCDLLVKELHIQGVSNMPGFQYCSRAFEVCVDGKYLPVDDRENADKMILLGCRHPCMKPNDSAYDPTIKKLLGQDIHKATQQYNENIYDVEKKPNAIFTPVLCVKENGVLGYANKVAWVPLEEIPLGEEVFNAYGIDYWIEKTRADRKSTIVGIYRAPQKRKRGGGMTDGKITGVGQCPHCEAWMDPNKTILEFENMQREKRHKETKCKKPWLYEAEFAEFCRAFDFKVLSDIVSTGASEPSKRSIFTLLNCSSNASAYEMRQAYKQAALRLHPDKNVSADAATKAENEKEFKEITNAYNTLERSSGKDNAGDNVVVLVPNDGEVLLKFMRGKYTFEVEVPADECGQ